MKIAEVTTLIFRLAVRNLGLYRFKTLVIGLLLGSGAFLAVLGLSLLRDVENSMQASIVESVAGHLQVYSNKAKDDLSMFGSSFMGRENVGTLSDFAPYRDEALKNANVEAFVPMGLDTAILGRGNELDDTLDGLRSALKAGDQGIVQGSVDQLRFQVQQLENELAERRKIFSDVKDLDEQAAALAKVKEASFLDTLKADDEEKLQFLETKIAPLSGEKQPIYLAYLGADIELHRNNFSKFKIVEGEALPQGSRGIMISNKVRETQLKSLVARLFDTLNKRIHKQGIQIANDPENMRNAADLPRQYSQILRYLDRTAAEELSGKLEALGIAETEKSSDLIERLTAQLQLFLKVDDSNFTARYQWFYQNIAPKIKLYEISPGETITLRSYTRSGYIKSLPLKIYGVYSFSGLEDSDLAGALNIIDLVSFRELYGQMTESSRKELDDMRAQSGIRELDQASAEDSLFGSASTVQIENRANSTEGSAASAAASRAALEIKPVVSSTFEVSEIQSGLALNAAVKLKDASKLEQTKKELAEAFKAKGFDARVVSWQDASGIVGQFVNIVRLALVFALVVIFVVALVIINNSIIVSTYNRMREIGTMRAMGAQRSFVLGLFLAETGLTGFLGAIVGTLTATVALLFLSRSGIPAANDVVTFLFSGPRLYPSLWWPVVVQVPFFVTLFATLTSVYAARHAASVKPAEAMQEKE